MADELDVLLDKVTDPTLRAELRVAVDKVKAKRTFGLVFESHLPERVMLPDHPVRRGARVVRRDGQRAEPMKVESVRREVAWVAGTDGAAEIPVDDLVVVAEFGEPVYPGLSSVGSIRRGGDKPSHVVINAENHHALEMLQFTHSGTVDCIYIDPPYNTGKRDWTYNNDFVDKDDGYRHSKWLAFMEKRLRLAKQLLAGDGVLIVTIDEHEVHRLALLLEQIFPSYRRPMVTIVMNSAGNTQNGFYRVEEHALFCFPPGVGPCLVPDDLLADEGKKQRSIWGTHIRTGGINDTPAKRPNLVYPIAVDPATNRFVKCGPSLEERLARGALGSIDRTGLNDWLPDPTEALDGLPVCWPFSENGRLGTWRNDATKFAELVADGFVRIRPNPNAPGSNRWSISYVTEGNRKKVVEGAIPTLGYDPIDNSRLLGDPRRPVIPKSVWKRRLHDATNWGSPILGDLVGPNAFTYPKSPYAVRDALRTVLEDRKEGVVLDFFAGSGTTLQAVSMLNSADGGSRRAILVTNNEVGDDAQRLLTSVGVRPGDDEWEAQGVFEAVTRPRCLAVVTGARSDGTPVPGTCDESGHLWADGYAENLDFMKLTYLDPVDVELDRAFASIAPMLWMRAGSQGSIVDSRVDFAGELLSFAVADRYGVLFDPDRWRDFVEALPATAVMAFVVTDSPAIFSGVAESLPVGLDAVRLYENYLTTFAINQGRGVS